MLKKKCTFDKLVGNIKQNVMEDLLITTNNEFDIQRKVIAFSTQSSWKVIPHASVIYEADLTEFYTTYKKLKNELLIKFNGKKKFSLNTILLKVFAEGFLASPVLNSTIKYSSFFQTGKIDIQDSVNITVPWELEDGKTTTIVIHDVGKKSLIELIDEIEMLRMKTENTNFTELLYRVALKDTLNKIKSFDISVVKRLIAIGSGKNKVNLLKGKKKKEYYDIPQEFRLTEKDIMSGTVIVSNIGSTFNGFKGHIGLLNVIAPQILAIGVSALEDRVGIINHSNEIGIRKILPICLTMDHRALDFNHFIPFFRKLDEIFSSPEIIYSW